MSPDLDVAIVGAGVAGLAAAHELTRAGLSVRVFEARDRVGGRMSSLRRDGYTLDEGAEQVPSTGYRATWELLARLGIRAADVPLIGASIAMWRDGRAQPGVSDPRGLLSGAGLSPRARVDLARYLGRTAAHRGRFDADRPERTPLGALTVAEFARRYHPDLHDYLFEPVVGGFFGWDTARSAAAPFVSLMLEVGTVPTWRSYTGGMDTLARRLAETVDVATGTEVQEVVAERGCGRLVTESGRITARSVLLCVPAPVAARLHANPPPAEREYLAACTFTSMVKVGCLLDRPLSPESSRTLYALLLPRAENTALGGIVVDHNKHPDRAPAGRGLLSLIAAPPVVPGLLDASDVEVASTLCAPAERYLPGLRAATTATVVHRFRHGLPEATPKALRLRAGFAARPAGPVDYAGDWVLLRPSSEGAVRSAAVTAARVVAHLRSTVDLRRRETV